MYPKGNRKLHAAIFAGYTAELHACYVRDVPGSEKGDTVWNYLRKFWKILIL